LIAIRRHGHRYRLFLKPAAQTNRAQEAIYATWDVLARKLLEFGGLDTPTLDHLAEKVRNPNTVGFEMSLVLEPKDVRELLLL
jgi:hypothetical protein